MFEVIGDTLFETIGGKVLLSIGLILMAPVSLPFLRPVTKQVIKTGLVLSEKWGGAVDEARFEVAGAAGGQVAKEATQERGRSVVKKAKKAKKAKKSNQPSDE